LFAGTINEFVTGLMQRAPGASSVPPMAIIPGGTGNSIATSMGIDNVELAGVDFLSVQCMRFCFILYAWLVVLHASVCIRVSLKYHR
jgi:hypothetical protein